jgi:hypothetical protein
MSFVRQFTEAEGTTNIGAKGGDGCAIKRRFGGVCFQDLERRSIM